MKSYNNVAIIPLFNEVYSPLDNYCCFRTCAYAPDRALMCFLRLFSLRSDLIRLFWLIFVNVSDNKLAIFDRFRRDSQESHVTVNLITLQVNEHWKQTSSSIFDNSQSTVRGPN